MRWRVCLIPVPRLLLGFCCYGLWLRIDATGESKKILWVEEKGKVFQFPPKIWDMQYGLSAKTWVHAMAGCYSLWLSLFYLQDFNNNNNTNNKYNMIFEWSSGDDESVHQNNASMIEMLTFTIQTKFLYAGWTTLYTCVWVYHPPPNSEIPFHVCLRPLFGYSIFITVWCKN